MTTNVDLTLTIKALDKATAPIRALTAHLNKVSAPTKRLSSLFGEFSKAANFGEIGSSLKGVGSEIFSLGARLAALGAGGAFALYKIVSGAIDAGDELATISQRVGVAVDTYASLAFAAEQADVSQEAFSSAMDKFNKNLGEAKAGGGTLLSFLQKVSPALATQVKGAKSTEEALSLMTDAYSRVTDPAKRAALSAAAFGKGGLQMGQFLGQGSEAIQAYQADFIALSGSQEEFAKRSSDLDNVIRRSTTALTGIRNSIAVGLYPAITKISNAVSDFVIKNREGIAKWAEKTGTAISEWVDGGGLTRLVDGIMSLGKTIVSVIEWLGPFGTGLAVVTVAMAPLIASVVSLGAALIPIASVVLPLLVSGLSAAYAALAPLVTAMAIAAAPMIALTLALTGILLAGKALYDNWSDIVFIFKDWLTTIDMALTKLGGLRGILSKPWGMLQFAGEVLGGGATENSALTPDAQARMQRQAAVAQQTKRASLESSVNVSFSNMPRGATVSTESNASQNVSTDVGYSSQPQ